MPQYQHLQISFLLNLNELLIIILCLFFLAFTGFYPAFWLILQKKIIHEFLAKIVYIFFFPFFGLLLLPSYLIRTYYLANASGILKQTINEWLVNFFWENILGFIFAVMLVFLLYWVIDKFRRKWWMVLGCVAILFYALTINFFPRLIMGEARKTEIKSGAYFSEIKRLVPNQKIRLFKLIDGNNENKLFSSAFDVYVIDVPQEKRFYLGAEIFDKFTSKEISSLLVHEIGHLAGQSKNYSILITSVLIFLSFYLAHLFIIISLKYFNMYLHIDRFQEPSSLALILLALIVSSTLFFLPASNALSRYQEMRADIYSLRLIGDKETAISALKKLHHLNGIDSEPAIIMKIFFEDHPSLKERIKYIKLFPLLNDKGK